MTDNSIMPFGKYKGEKLCNVSAKYLLWLYYKGCYGELKEYIVNNLDVLEKELDEQIQKQNNHNN